jgi:hypothetical protein
VDDGRRGDSSRRARHRHQAAGDHLLLVGLDSFIVYFMHTKKYWVAIRTAGGEANAISYNNPLDPKRVVDAINEAIVRRR